jgi:hypothetical protein
MTIKSILVASLFLLLTGCSLSYQETISTHKNFRVVSIQTSPEPKADLMDMADFQMYYDQPLSARCASLLKAGDYTLMNKVVLTVAGISKTTLENINNDENYCIKATPEQIDKIGTAFDH